jgi:hypothetical protein
MADPISGSIIAAELAPTVAATIPELAATTALSAPFAAEAATATFPNIVSQAAIPLTSSSNPLVSALGQGQIIGGMSNPVVGSYGANGESLFGFDTTGGGIGQGIMEQLGQVNKFMNQNPVTTQLGMKAAGSLLPQQQHIQMAPQGQVSRGQVQPMDYMSLLNPQQQSVLRPQPISLL